MWRGQAVARPALHPAGGPAKRVQQRVGRQHRRRLGVVAGRAVSTAHGAAAASSGVGAASSGVAAATTATAATAASAASASASAAAAAVTPAAVAVTAPAAVRIVAGERCQPALLRRRLSVRTQRRPQPGQPAAAQ